MAATEVTIRPIVPADRADWDRLWTGYLSFYETTLPETTFDTAFDRLLSDDPSAFRGLLAWEGKRAPGLVHWVRHPHLWRPEGVVYLQDLYTVPEARGRGVARRLIEAVYAAADAVGSPRVYWLTQETNYPGRILYDRVGRRSGFIRYDRP